MTRLRHLIATRLYAAASRIDAPGGYGGDTRFGNFAHWPRLRQEVTSTQYQMHARGDTPIGANFRPGKTTFATLQIGLGVDLTIFLTRTFTRRMISVLQLVEAEYAKHGEGEG